MEHMAQGESDIDGTTVVRYRDGRPGLPPSPRIGTLFARSVESPSCVTSDALQTENETNATTLGASMGICQTSESANGTTDLTPRVPTTQTEGADNGAEWKLGTPYYRNDGPQLRSKIARTKHRYVIGTQAGATQYPQSERQTATWMYNM